MSPSRIHHINFVVRDLDEAMTRFQHALDLDEFEVIEHRPRGAHVARTRIGESWLVLVSPFDPESVPGRFLSEHGEGFFLISLGYPDIVQQLERLEDSGVDPIDKVPRSGVLDWRVADIGPLHGSLLQLTEDGSNDGN